MDNFVLGFNDFLNEEINYTRDSNGICTLEDHWFYYVEDDDIIYGCDEKPVDGYLFAFNPKSCLVIFDGDEHNYDVNNPICLFWFDIDKNELRIYTDDALNELENMGFTGSDIRNPHSSDVLNDIFEKDDDRKYLLIYGNQMIASTFDVIEEN